MKKTYYLFACAMFFIGQAMSQSILEWNFFGGTGTAVSYNSSYNDKDLQLSVLSRGSGAAVGNGCANGFVGKLAVSANLEEAIANNAYYEFSIQANTGSTFSITSIDANIRTQSTSAKSYQWMYSQNGGVYIAIGASVTVANEEIDVNNGIYQARINVSDISDLQNIASTSAVTIRLYAWGGGVDNTLSTSNFGFGKSTNVKPTITIRGTTNSLATISHWNFGTFNVETTAGSATASTANANLESVMLSRGAGLSPAQLTYGYASYSLNLSSTKEQAQVYNEYYEIAVKAASGYNLSLDRFIYKYRRFSTGDNTFKWAYSTDNVNFTEIGAENQPIIENSLGTFYTLDLSAIEPLQHVDPTKTVKLRMYVWGSSLATVVSGFGVGYSGATENLVLKGKVQLITSIDAPDQNHNAYVKVFASVDGIKLNLLQDVSKNAQLRISDISGKVLLNQFVSLQSGENKITIPVELVKGIYFLTVDNHQVKFIR
ncbi:MAG: T9SS type A sorting domain-containing protein [Paludibacter sp.]|nr:T9SS type A sorting domain-containing protein [Paludibacter sp.]